MRFEIRADQAILTGRVVYRRKDYSFDFEPDSAGIDKGLSSLVFHHDTIHLKIDEKGCILYVWGYEPLIKVESTDSGPPEFKRKGLVALLDEEIIPGVSIGIGDPGGWPVFVNRTAGWICFGSPTVDAPFEAVEFASNSVAVLKQGFLRALWLRPEFLPSSVLRFKNSRS